MRFNEDSPEVAELVAETGISPKMAAEALNQMLESSKRRHPAGFRPVDDLFAQAAYRERKAAHVAEADVRNFKEREDGPPEPTRIHPRSQVEAVDQWLRRTRGTVRDGDTAPLETRVSVEQFERMEKQWQQQQNASGPRSRSFLERMLAGFGRVSRSLMGGDSSRSPKG